MDRPKIYNRIVEIGGVFITIRTIIDIVNIPKDFAEAGDYIIDNLQFIIISSALIGFLLLIYLVPFNYKINFIRLLRTKKVEENLTIENEKSSSGSRIIRKITIVIGIISVMISLFASGVIFYSYLQTKNIYYAQIDSASSREEAVKKVLRLNKILETKNEEYLHIRALETKNKTYMITVRRGFMAKINAEKALKEAEILLNDNPKDNRIYSTDKINWRKKLIYMFN